MMAKESGGFLSRAASLEELQDALPPAQARALPPVHLWNPPFCGDIDMRIARDGTWFYSGTPITRPALVGLFSSILRRDGDAYLLVTPVEKVGIVVEDAPFVGVELKRAAENDGPVLWLRTNVDDWVRIDAEHALRFEPGEAGGTKPYVHVRANLWALLTRALLFELVEGAESRMHDEAETLGVVSAGVFFPIGAVDAVGAEP